MKDQITIEEANNILKKYLSQPHLLHHSRETEVVMRALAKHFGEDEEFWGVTGLLHDLDMEAIGRKAEIHGTKACEMLAEEGFDIQEMFKAIKSHVETLGFLDVKRETKLEYCLSAAENVTGLVTAYALMRPEKLEGMKASSLNKKFKSKAFAANVNRELINDIEKIGLQKNEFFEIAIKAIQSIASEIGL
ncbi:HDIG domain-containing protein [Candidatus Parcubacteria bacterium]|nr:HDIG domain-containing protein [Candidatus Parcubacteria bacterium]